MYYYKYTHDIRSLKDQHNTYLFSIIVCLTCWKFKLYKTKKSIFFSLKSLTNLEVKIVLFWVILKNIKMNCIINHDSTG